VEVGPGGEGMATSEGLERGKRWRLGLGRLGYLELESEFRLKEEGGGGLRG